MRRRKERKWRLPDDDPTSGLTNLVDVWMVFAIVLLLALIASGAIHDKSDGSSRETTASIDSEGRLEIIERDGIRVSKMRVTEQQLSGNGERLGTAYRLKSGEVLYVPDVQASNGVD